MKLSTVFIPPFVKKKKTWKCVKDKEEKQREEIWSQEEGVVWIGYLKVWGMKLLMNTIRTLQALGHRDRNKVEVFSF